MKKLALLLPAMRMGGAEKICLNFLNELINHYEVTMILTKKEGAFLEYVPQSVIVIEDELKTFQTILKEDIQSLHLGNIFKDIKYYLKVKLKKDTEYDYKYLVDRTPKVSMHFDCAIGYVANVSTQIFCFVDRIQADIKIAWIHGETTELKDTQLYNSCYCQFDKIFVVSKVSLQHFIDRFPDCTSISEVYYNPINQEQILTQSNAPIYDIVFDSKFTNIVTVGEFHPKKDLI